MLRRSGILGVALGLAFSVGLVGIEIAPAGGGRTSGSGTTCPMFPANNVWNTKISRLPVHPKSRDVHGRDAQLVAQPAP